MPDLWDCLIVRPVKIYRGWYGDTARTKITWSQRAKGFRAVFPDC